MRKPNNPFIVSGYHSPAYFCDRSSEQAWLKDQFSNERNMVLYSWRRMGKTALVRHFFHYLEKGSLADCLFADLLGTSSLPEANRRIVSAIVSRFGEVEKGIGPRLLKLIGSIGATVGIDPVSGAPQLSFGLVRDQAVPGSLEAVGTYLSERKKPLILCIDEFQQIVNYAEAHAEAVFRTWMQNFPMIRFIFCGSHRHMMVSMFSEESRPFYRSAQLLELNPLPRKEYTGFIRSWFEKNNKSIDDILIQSVFDWTRMQTYYVQLVCNKLFGRTGPVGENTLVEIFREILQQEIPLFSSYQQLFTAYQWKLLVAIAKSGTVENPHAQSFLSQYELGAASSVSAALKTLVNKEFVIRQDKVYTLHDTLLMRWLQGI